MKTMKLHSAALTALVIASFALSNCVAQTPKNAVNIVFTEEGKTQIIDTVINADDDALEALLTHHDLDFSNIHLVDLSSIARLAQEPKMLFIEMDAEHVNGDEKTIVRVIDMEEEMTNKADRANRIAEEMRMEIEEARRLSEDLATEVSESMSSSNFTIHIIDDETGDETHVEVEEADGETTMKGTKNGKKMNQKQLDTFMKEHEENMHWNEESDHNRKQIQRIEVISDHSEDSRFMEHQIADGDMRAVVIIKPLASNKKDHAPLESAETLNVFPNPAKGKATVNATDVSGTFNLTLRSIKGEVVWQEKGKAKNNLEQEIDLKGIASGTYILTLDHKKGTEVTRMIVE
jgi:hypothetical protein